MLKKLKIPRVPGAQLPPEAPRLVVQRDFATKNSLSAAEAKYYLEEANWDEDAAERLLKGDVEWERTHGDSVPRGAGALSVEMPVPSASPSSGAAAATLRKRG